MTSQNLVMGDDLLADRAQIQALIDDVADEVPDSVLDAARITNAAIAAKQRELGDLIGQREKIDAAFQVSQREAAERSSYERDREIKRTAAETIEVNKQILADLTEAQANLRGFVEAIVRCRKRFPIAQAGVNRLDMPSSFSLADFNRRLSQWIAGELCYAWPRGGDRLGEYVSFREPPYFQSEIPHKIPRWSDREMDDARRADIERLAALVEERSHIR